MEKKEFRVRLAGIVPMGDGFAFMHRIGVQNHPIGEYYVFPGGGQDILEFRIINSGIFSFS